MKIKCDSRLVKKGDTFIALRGHKTDGHNYIEDAINNGCKKIVVENDNDYDILKEVVPDTKEYLVNYLTNNYSKKLEDITLIGVTGTNGKTTICFLIYQILKLLNYKVAYIGTIGYFKDDFVKNLNNTTPDILEVYNLLLDASKSKIEYVVMEVSSHSLDYQRLEGLKFSLVVFTNLTKDHLDHHLTMENYLNSKLKIFNYLKDDAVVITNTDSEYGKYFEKGNYKTVGTKDCDYKIIDYECLNDSSFVGFEVDNVYYGVNINLINKYNAYNYVEAFAVIDSLGVDKDDIVRVSHNVWPPKGRCDMINYKTNIVVVDYAHTPDAVSNVLNSFRDNALGKIYTIIGCGGNRDRTKRPQMAQISTDISDYVIFTDDNPRYEDENTIINDMIEWLTNNNYIIIHNRKTAIEKGIDMLCDKDILLILGKGHEDYQIIKDQKLYFDDKVCAQNYIDKKLKKL